jgi:hypothetical protein
LGSSSQEVVDATVVTPRIFALRIDRGRSTNQTTTVKQGAEEKLYILAKKPAIYILENIREYESALHSLSSKRNSRITCKGQKMSMYQELFMEAAM